MIEFKTCDLNFVDVSAEKLTFEKKPKTLRKKNLSPNFFGGFLVPLDPPVIKFSPPLKFFNKKSTFPESQLFRRQIYLFLIKLIRLYHKRFTNRNGARLTPPSMRRWNRLPNCSNMDSWRRFPKQITSRRTSEHKRTQKFRSSIFMRLFGGFASSFFFAHCFRLIGKLKS